MPLKRKHVMKSKTRALRPASSEHPASTLIKTRFVDPASVGLDPKMLRDYEDTQDQLVRKGVIPGCASVVIRKGKIVQSRSWGFSDVEKKSAFDHNTLCRIFCSTKSFVATAFFTLVEEGLVSLDDRLDKYIPAFGKVRVRVKDSKDEPTTKTEPPKKPILLKYLMVHTTGLSYPCDLGETPQNDDERAYMNLSDTVEKGKIPNLKSFVDALAKLPLVCHPGGTYYYGYSYEVLARVVEIITGKRIDKVLQERVFEPLGMRETMYSVANADVGRLSACYVDKTTFKNVFGKRVTHCPRPGMYRYDGNTDRPSRWRVGQTNPILSGGGFLGYKAGGGLVSTVADHVLFVWMLYNRGLAANGRRLLKTSTVKLMERNQLKKAFNPTDRVCYLGNIGVFRDGADEVGMGGAACTYWNIDREDDAATVWFTQSMAMPDFGDKKGMRGVSPKNADLWALLHKASLKDAKKAPRTSMKKAAAKKRKAASSSKSSKRQRTAV